jgi:hypothetical protein
MRLFSRFAFIPILAVFLCPAPSEAVQLRVTLRNQTGTTVRIVLRGAESTASVQDTLQPGDARVYLVQSNRNFMFMTRSDAPGAETRLDANQVYRLLSGGRLGEGDIPTLTAPEHHRVIWDFNGGKLYLHESGKWFEQREDGSGGRNYREVGRTSAYIEIQAENDPNLSLRLYHDHCKWKTTDTRGSWEYRSQGSWRGNNRVRFVYSGGTGEFKDQHNFTWAETQGSRMIRTYQETSRTALYIELRATDGSGFAFRLYERNCQRLMSGAWSEVATGYWTR